MNVIRLVIGTAAVLLAGNTHGETPIYVAARKPWDAALGSHRAVINVDSPASAVRARLEWRRRDHHPEQKAVLVFNAKSGKRCINSVAINVTNEAGDIVFEAAAAGEYVVYFLPVKLTGGAFPVSHYQPPEDKAVSAWKARAGITDGSWTKLPTAPVTRWEARTTHDAWTDMEIIATREEVDAVAARFADRPIALFAEDGEHSVRMFDFLPAVDRPARRAGGETANPCRAGRWKGAIPNRGLDTSRRCRASGRAVRRLRWSGRSEIASSPCQMHYLSRARLDRPAHESSARHRGEPGAAILVYRIPAGRFAGGAVSGRSGFLREFTEVFTPKRYR